MKKAGKVTCYVILSFAVFSLIAWDMLQVKSAMVNYPLYKLLDSVNHIKTTPTTVSIVGSDYSGLSSPTALNNALTEVQIDSMVSKALDLQGSAKQLFTPGKKYLIKPNIVGAVADQIGENTDTRVIKALVKYIHRKTGGSCSILIGEGSPRPMGYEVPYSGTAKKWTKLWDLTGYPTLLSQLKGLGINVDTVNLNGGAINYLTGLPLSNSKENLQERTVPYGGFATPQGGKYYIHKAIVNADVYITVPVLKVHNPGITNALKNQIGIAPGNHYGFNKMQGVIADGRVNKLTHNNDAMRDWTDEEIVDLSLLCGIDLVVVDAIMCLNQQKTYNGSNQVQMNTILVGNDPVAVDNVCARLTGFNPDDVDHIALAELAGMGTNNPDLITTVGSTMEHVYKRLKKLTSDYRLMFGQGNRKWLVSPSYAIGSVTDPINYAFITDEANFIPSAGINGWSKSMYFFDDRIDLGNYYSYANNIVSYVFAHVYSPAAKNAVLWVGSDEAMKIYLNKTAVYTFNSSRTYGDNTLLSEKVNISLNKGYNTLLVKTVQKNGNHDFALNICEVEADLNFEGNRVTGLKFIPDLNATQTQNLKPNVLNINCFPNPATENITIKLKAEKIKSCNILVYDLGGKLIKRLGNRNMTSGEISLTWNLDDAKGRKVPAGHYIIMEEQTRQYSKVVVR